MDALKAALNFEQIGQVQAAAMDSMLRLSQSMADQVEKMAQLQLDAGREALASVQALAAVRDAEGLADWQAAFFQPGLEAASENARRQYAVMLDMRNLLAEAIRQSAADATEQLQAGIEQLASDSPEGMAPFFIALREGFNSQLATMERMSRLGAQVDALTGASQLLTQAAEPPAPRKRAPARRKQG